MPAPQTYKSHVSRDPIFLCLVFVFGANFGFAVFHAVHDSQAHLRTRLWAVVIALALAVLAALVRRYSLRQQDRIIRLEERLRLAALLPAAEHPLAHTLTTRQLIALRFAPDAELPSLARRAAAENLSAKQIKQAITTWRPDHQRI